MDRALLVAFKDLKISKKDLCDKLGSNLIALSTETPVIVNSFDVINMLNAYKIGKYSVGNILDWVNTIWFTELYAYNDEQSNSIASIMNKLEELDEKGYILSNVDVDRYIIALQNNQEIQ